MSLPYDPDVAIKALVQADPPLERLIEQVGPFRLELRSMPRFREVEAYILERISSRGTKAQEKSTEGFAA